MYKLNLKSVKDVIQPAESKKDISSQFENHFYAVVSNVSNSSNQLNIAVASLEFLLQSKLVHLISKKITLN